MRDNADFRFYRLVSIREREHVVPIDRELVTADNTCYGLRGDTSLFGLNTQQIQNTFVKWAQFAGYPRNKFSFHSLRYEARSLSLWPWCVTNEYHKRERERESIS